MAGFVFPKLRNDVAAHKKGADAPPRPTIKPENPTPHRSCMQKDFLAGHGHFPSPPPFYYQLEQSSVDPAIVMKTMLVHGH
jgi:hypothetical protein